PPARSAFVGEVALTGLVRPAPAMTQRLAAARAAGITTVFGPVPAAGQGSDQAVRMIPVRHLRDALAWAFGGVENLPDVRSA
nr:hypothetical protein [Actinomycetota bacterium]